MIYLIHWMLFCFFNSFKGTLALDKLKSIKLTTSKILRNIYWVWNVLDFNTQSHLIIKDCLETYSKLLSQLCISVPFLKRLKLLLWQLKKRICDLCDLFLVKRSTFNNKTTKLCISKKIKSSTLLTSWYSG